MFSDAGERLSEETWQALIFITEGAAPFSPFQQSSLLFLPSPHGTSNDLHHLLPPQMDYYWRPSRLELVRWTIPSTSPCSYVLFCLSIRKYIIEGSSNFNVAFMQRLHLSVWVTLYVGLLLERVDEAVCTAIMSCTRFAGVQLCLDLLRQRLS